MCYDYFLDTQTTNDDLERNMNNIDMAEDQLAIQLHQIIEHFKQEDPVGLPMVPMEDPISVPDVRQSMSVAMLTLTNAKLYGISQFRLKHILTEVKEMEAKCGIHFDNLILNGSYTLSSLFAKSQGWHFHTVCH